MFPLVSSSFRQVDQRVWHHLLTTTAFSTIRPERVADTRTGSNKPLPNQPTIRINSLIVLQARERFSVVLTLPADANPDKHRISVRSPLGAALLGLQAGDRCTVAVEGIRSTFTVIQVIH